MDPGTAISVVSLGLEVCKDLFKYYEQVRDANENIRMLYTRASEFRDTLNVVKQIIDGKQCSKRVYERIDSICARSEQAIERLRGKLEKVMKYVDSKELAGKITHAAVRMVYPLRGSTLWKLKEMIDEVQAEMAILIPIALEEIQERTLREGFKELSDDVRVLQKDLREFRRDQKFDELMEWLTATDTTSDQKAACQLKQSGTGKWIFDTKEVKQWIVSGGNTLWLHGKMGCGKTVLCATLVEHIEALCAVNPRLQSAYYYFSFKEGAKQNLQNCIPSLIAQLCGSRPPPKSLQDLHNSHKNERPNTAKLQIILSELIEDCEDTYILLDAIDECPETNNHRDIVLQFIGHLHVSSASRLHLLVLSRNNTDIREVLCEKLSATELSIEAKQIRDDISWYVRNQLTRHRRLSSALPLELMERTIEKLVDAANGMFRWAYCQVERLKRLRLARTKDIEHILKTLPETLNESYERILCDIPDSERDAAVAALRILAFTTESITPWQLSRLCIIDPQDPAMLGKENVISADGLYELISSMVIVERRHERHYVNLAHFSVREYLLSEEIKKGAASAFAMETDSCNSFLATGLLLYILQCSSDFPTDSSQEANKMYPNLDYARSEWRYHDKQVQLRGSKEADVIFLSVLLDETLFRNMLRVYLPDGRRDSPGSPLYYAVYLGLDFCFLELLQKGLDVNATGGMYHTALQAAAGHGETVMFSHLLNAGADLRLEGGHYRNALGAAASKGHKDIINIILQKGSEPPESRAAAALSATSIGRLDIVTCFLTKEDIAATPRILERLLRTAVWWGQVHMVKYLLSIGADVHARGIPDNGKAASAIQVVATSRAREHAVEIAALLIENGAEVDTIEGHYGTALLCACHMMNTDTAILFLRNRADPNLRAGNGEAPLEVAVRKGLRRLANALQDYGAKLQGHDAEISKCGGQRQYVAMEVIKGTYFAEEFDPEGPGHTGLFDPELGLEL